VGGEAQGPVSQNCTSNPSNSLRVLELSRTSSNPCSPKNGLNNPSFRCCLSCLLKCRSRFHGFLVLHHLNKLVSHMFTKARWKGSPLFCFIGHDKEKLLDFVYPDRLHTHTHTRTHTHAHTHIHTRTHTHTHTHTQTHKHTRTHTHTQAHMHTHKHTHTHENIGSQPQKLDAIH